jgi:imidazoleglycerol phosphate dehydratase HisB
MEGEDSQHVLSAIFKALGVALGEACSEASARG